jgi:hypothetical protein
MPGSVASSASGGSGASSYVDSIADLPGAGKNQAEDRCGRLSSHRTSERIVLLPTLAGVSIAIQQPEYHRMRDTGTSCTKQSAALLLLSTRVSWCVFSGTATLVAQPP